MKLMELQVQTTRTNDDDDLFPKQWRGLFEALSSSDDPLQRAESWLAESKWHLRSWKMEPLWPDLMKALRQKEPCCISNSLKFVPKIQLLPLSLQRNLLSFIVHHALEISTDSLVLLRDCYGDPNSDLIDQWSALHLKDLQNKICLRKDKAIEYKASDIVTTKTKNRISEICQRLLGDGTNNFEKKPGNVDFEANQSHIEISPQLSEIAPSLTLGHSPQSNLTNQREGAETSSTNAGDHLVNPSTGGGQDDTTRHRRTDITRPSTKTTRPTSTETTRTSSTAKTWHSRTETTRPTSTETTRHSSSETTKHSSTDVFDTNLPLPDDVVTTSAPDDLSEKRSSGGCNNATKRQMGNIENAIDGGESFSGDPEMEHKRQRVEISEKSLLAQEEMEQLGADVKMKLENIGHAWLNSQKSSDELGFLGNLNDTQMNIACRILKLEKLDMKHLVTVCQQIVKISDNLSMAGVSLLAKHCFMKKILDLIHPPSRHLINAMVVFAEAFPRPIVQSILVPVVQSNTFAGAQCSLATSIVKDALKIDHKHELLRKIFKEEFQWNAHVTSLVQSMIDSKSRKYNIKIRNNEDKEQLQKRLRLNGAPKKLQLNEGDLNLITSGLQHQASDQSSCPKFAKLLHALVKKYGNQLTSDHVTSLRKSLDSNKTFLKKAVLAAIDRLQL